MFRGALRLTQGRPLGRGLISGLNFGQRRGTKRAPGAVPGPGSESAVQNPGSVTFCGTCSAHDRTRVWHVTPARLREHRSICHDKK